MAKNYSWNYEIIGYSAIMKLFGVENDQNNKLDAECNISVQIVDEKFKVIISAKAGRSFRTAVQKISNLLNDKLLNQMESFGFTKFTSSTSYIILDSPFEVTEKIKEMFGNGLTSAGTTYETYFYSILARDISEKDSKENNKDFLRLVYQLYNIKDSAKFVKTYKVLKLLYK